MSEEVKSYTTHNYNAVDRQVHEMALREAEITRQLSIANGWRIVRVAGLALLAIGIFFLILAIAYRIAFSPEPMIDKEALHRHTAEAIPLHQHTQNPQSLEQKVASLQDKTENTGSGGKSNVIFFYRVPSDIIGFGNVNTRYHYENSQDENPEKWSCYVQRHHENRILAIELGAQQWGEQPVMDVSASADSGLSQEQAQSLFANKCLWGKV